MGNPAIAPRGHYLTATQLSELRRIANENPIMHALLNMYAMGDMSPGEWAHLAIATLGKAYTNSEKRYVELAMKQPPEPIIVCRDRFFHVAHIDAVGTLFQEAAVQMADAYGAGDEAKAKIFNDAVGAIKTAWPELVAKSLGKEVPDVTS